jgi:Derlin-2/3
LDLIFHIFFLQRYSRLLEETSGRSPARFSYLLTFAATCLLCVAPFFSIAFLGHPLSSILVYIWSRRNPDTLLSFLGLLVFKAPWLPWVLMAFSFAVHGSVPKDEICGVIIGHGESPRPCPLHTFSADMTCSLVLLQRHLPTDPQRTPSS